MMRTRILKGHRHKTEMTANGQSLKNLNNKLNKVVVLGYNSKYKVNIYEFILA